MATRSVVQIEDVSYAQLYVHWSGNPEHMLPWLKSFNEDFAKNRGDDPEYKFAQLLRFSVRAEDTFDLDPSEYTGYGIMPFGEDYGQEFTYLLKTDGTVTYKKH